MVYNRVLTREEIRSIAAQRPAKPPPPSPDPNSQPKTVHSPEARPGTGKSDPNESAKVKGPDTGARPDTGVTNGQGITTSGGFSIRNGQVVGNVPPEVVIPRLASGIQQAQDHADVQALLRQELRTYVAGLGADALPQFLASTDPEIKLAAVLACAKHKSRVPDLVGLLEDSNPAISQGAHLALVNLSGRDFGPPANATAEQRAKSFESWKAWAAKVKPDR
jgi:hypothetical protein